MDGMAPSPPQVQPKPVPPSQDYAGAELSVGDTVVFIGTAMPPLLGAAEAPSLLKGTIVLIHGEQICIQSGRLVTFNGMKLPSPTSRDKDLIRYTTVALIQDTDEVRALLDAERRQLEEVNQRCDGYATAVQEVLRRPEEPDLQRVDAETEGFIKGHGTATRRIQGILRNAHTHPTRGASDE